MTKRTSKTKLDRRLVLLAWLHEQFGYKTNQEMLADLKECAEGYDDTGRSYVHRRLESRGRRAKAPLEDLVRYDQNIRAHLRAVNAGRGRPIVFRYFQHAAALYTELYLDWALRRPADLVESLNEAAYKRNQYKTYDDRFPTMQTSDLRRLAYWMATGSGKTLIMHVNYRQFLHYKARPLDNIVLVTPNEGLTRQHIAEMRASGIPCRRFDLDDSGLLALDRDTVQVVEITKLVEKKRGGGASVPVEAFEGANLVFVDEGHRGTGGEAWRRAREAVGKGGFTFEYSATFGQALASARNQKLTAEYGKSIGFDYSYRYFHSDGYGKDFRILNLQEEREQDATDTLLLGNLLSFYEQMRAFDEHEPAIRPYNLEHPLWVFVGGTVNAVYSLRKQKRSDVLTVARFFHRVLANPDGWAVETASRLLEGDSGLRRADGRDVFADRFASLREDGLSAEALYRDVLARVFHASASGGLHLGSMRGSRGEIGLRASTADRCFGVIYIGDVGAFVKLARQDDPGFVFEHDVVGDSLFEGIADPEGGVNVLVGARKFMEGWNSWRVANMGLMNIGRTEGSQIIQLFGRGVRLRGKGFGLKRSSALDGEHPPDVKLLETLDIFAVRADYMFQFRNYLEQEGVDTRDVVELRLDAKPNRAFLDRGLLVPRMPDERSFVDEEDMFLERDDAIRVRVDKSVRVRTLDADEDGIRDRDARSGQSQSIPATSLALVDWQKVHLELVEYADGQGLANLALDSQATRRIVESEEGRGLYDLIADEHVSVPTSVEDMQLLEDVVLTVLKKYVDKFCRVRRERWDTEQVVYDKVSERDANFPRYAVRVPRGETALVEAIRELIAEGDRIYRTATADLPGIYFDRHLYQPLLVDRDARIQTTPPGLNAGEAQFVEDLRARCRAHGDDFGRGRELFLLRNLTQGRGIGFFDTRGFYPDFILWIKEGPAQRVVFVEPHGMVHARAYRHDDKARLHERLPALARNAAARSRTKNVSLDSYIVSNTPYEDLRRSYDDGTWTRERFAQAHIVFPERTDEYDYISIILGQRAAAGAA